MRFPNPIGRRLDRVRDTYAHRPEVFERTLQIAKKTAGKETIDPKETEAWEEYLPWVASNISKLAKKRDKGQISEAAFEAEVKKLGASFEEIVKPFVERKARGKGVKTKAKGRRVQLQQLSPKQAREHVKRVDRERGFRVVKKLGGGYVAVVATPNLKHGDMLGALRRGLIDGRGGKKAVREWVEENAPFQQWAGEKMGNCLQFYRVNYTAYGSENLEIQKSGGKLYVILNRSGNPVVAILTDPSGTVIETNGRNNHAPRGDDAKALERFEKAMWGGKVDRGTFDVDTDQRLVRIIETLSDELMRLLGVSARRRFIRQSRRYARQNGFDGEAVFRSFMVYILVESKYSVIRSVRKTDYGKRKDAERIIVRVARLISQNASRAKLEGAADYASRVMMRASRDDDYAEAAVSTARSSAARTAAEGSAAKHAAAKRAYANAIKVADHASAVRSAVNAAWMAAAAYTEDNKAEFAAGAGAYAGSAARLADQDRTAAHVDRAAAEAAYASRDADYVGDQVDGLLKIMRKEAERGGPQANPPKRKTVKKKVVKKKVTKKKVTKKKVTKKKVTKKKVTKKKVTRKKTPPYQLLINRCQKLWDYYCERPNKKRLKLVLEHLEKMKASTSKKVADERKRCLRVANKEAKKLGMK